MTTQAQAPRQVLLFSGHRVDAPDRESARFPPAMVPAAQLAIEQALDALQAGPEDLAFTQGAAGGDLLFAEACLARGVPLRLLLPLSESDFIQASVQTSPGDWVKRYFAVRAGLASPPQPIGPGDGAEDEDPFERCNRALLQAAAAWGSERVRLVVLWNGAEGDGPGGTAHMMREVQAQGGAVTWIDTRTL